MKKYSFKIWITGEKRKASIISVICDCIEKAWVKLLDELKVWKPAILQSALKMELFSVSSL